MAKELHMTTEEILNRVYNMTDVDAGVQLELVLAHTGQTANELYHFCLVLNQIEHGTIDAYILGVLDGMGWGKPEPQGSRTAKGIEDHEMQEKQRMDRIKDGETVCVHDRRPFECVICYPRLTVDSDIEKIRKSIDRDVHK
jgi:hypothetical protein